MSKGMAVNIAIAQAMNVQARQMQMNSIDPKSRAEHARQTPIAKYMRKHAKGETNDYQDAFALNQARDNIFMTFLFINFIFLSDDGELDKKELKSITKLLNTLPPILEPDHITKIEEINKQRTSLTQIKEYFTTHNIKETQFKETFFGLNKIIKSNKRYLQALKDIKNTYYDK
jgi:hypothetical protein